MIKTQIFALIVIISVVTLILLYSVYFFMGVKWLMEEKAIKLKEKENKND